jgi:hypothetical protein
METSIWIAKLLGPVLLVAAITMMVSPRYINEMASEFLKSRALIFFSGVLAMIAGLAIVNTHNVWMADWPVVITVFGWAMVIGGAVRMAAPNVVQAIGGRMLGNPTLTRVFGPLWAVVSVYLTYEGYF